ncbi:hypothetical protein AB1Y20_020695 [Prymnesium parvum]|uniref:MORN repeat-containing protein n=1 Tax=Prymnesium parvum TaxID=97485 RepID=A0AB34K054_PRYPA|mmetsp:Transcript_44034/g.100863  ORF Transcript_44034/g.100863 Transcript_44034/m.100863 type:complete len:665 (+) Transcript_44034:2523-4517(+)
MDPALPNVFEVETVPEVKPQESRSREGLTKWVYAFKDHKGAWGAYYGSFDEFGRPAGKGRIEYRQGATNEAAWNKASGSEFDGEFKHGRMWSGDYRFQDGRTVRMRTGKQQGGQGAADPIPPTHFLVTEKGRGKHGFYETYQAIGARDKSIRPLEIVADGEEAALEMRSDGWARVVKFRQDPKQSQDVTHHIKPALARGEGLVKEGELRTCFELYQKTAMMLLEGSLAPTDRQGLEKMLKKAKSKRSPKDKVAALKDAFELMLRSSIVRNGPYTKIDFGGNPWGWFPIDYESKAKLYILTSDQEQASTTVSFANKDSRNGAAAAPQQAPKVTWDVRAGPCLTAEKIGEKKLSECIVALEYSQFPGWLRFPDDGTLGFHQGVTCAVSRMSPIVGPRYQYIDLEKTFDVCQEVFESLRPSEKNKYFKVEAKTMPAAGWCISSSPSFKWLPEISSYATFEKKYFLFLRQRTTLGVWTMPTREFPSYCIHSFYQGGCVIAASEPMTERGEPIVINDVIVRDNLGWLRLADKTGWTRAGERNKFGWYLLPEGKGTDFVLAAETDVFAVYKQPGGWTPKNMTNVVQHHASFQHGAHIVAHVHPDFPDWLYLASGAGWVKRYINSKENPLPGWIEGATQIPEDVIQKMQENREKMLLLPTEKEDGCLCVVL